MNNTAKLCAALVTAFSLATAAPARAADPATWMMGSSTVDVTPPVGVPLAGYGGKERRILPFDLFNKHKYAHFLKPSEGVLDPIRSKAVVLTLGDKKVLFLSVDAIGVENVFFNDVKAHGAALGIQHFIISATHTHSGPGALGQNAFYAILATDRYVPSVYRNFLKGVKQSITEAAAMQEPVRLYRADFTANGFSHNRRNHPEQIDPVAHLLFGRNAKNEIVGGLVNYGVHSTVLGEDNLKFSADFAGGIERQLTRRLGSKNTFLFMSGPEGDVSPSVENYADIDVKGAAFAELAASAIAGAVEVPRSIRHRTGQFRMPKGKIRLEQCGLKLPKPLRKLAIGGAKLFPRNFELTQLELGDILMVTWPGEPTVELGTEARQVAASFGYANLWNMAVSNGYMGYFLTEHDWAEGDYEVCVSYHGQQAGRILVNSHTELLKF